MTYNINQPAETMTDAEVMACLNATRREVGDEMMISFVAQKFNASEIEIDADNCDIWIAKPMTGRYLRPFDQRELIDFIRAQ